MFIFSGCTKEEPPISNEVLLSLTNQCVATIKFYNVSDGKQALSDIFDCNYVAVLSVQLKPGTYRVVAENSFGRSAEVVFTKTKFFQELNIEF